MAASPASPTRRTPPCSTPVREARCGQPADPGVQQRRPQAAERDLLGKTAEAVGKVNAAIELANPEKIGLVAEKADKLVKALKDYDPKKVPDPKKLTKLNAAMVDADPDKIRAVASATGKLASSQRHFDPKKIPKARGLSSAAEAAERLALAGRDVAQAFDVLKTKAREATQAMA